MGAKDRVREDNGRQQRGRPGRPRGSQPDSEFINLELSKEQKEQYLAWREDLDTVVTGWANLCAEGYRVNTKWDDYSNSYAAFIIPDAESDNAGLILTGRGGTPLRAVCEAVYKHSVILPDGWGGYSAVRGGADDPDY